MRLLELFLIAVGLSMDAFAVPSAFVKEILRVSVRGCPSGSLKQSTILLSVYGSADFRL